MKNLFCAVMLTFSTLVSAQNKDTKIDLPVFCYNKDVVLKELNEKFEEKVLFAGIDDTRDIENLSSFLSLNQETETYTFGYYLPKNKMICIISSGNGNFLPGTLKDK